MNQQWAVDRMKALGWLPKDVVLSSPGFSFEAALIEYQQWAHLEVTGRLDDATIADLARLRICGQPDRMTSEPLRRAPTAKWFWAGPTLPTVSDVQLARDMQAAFDAWSAVCPISGTKFVAGSIDLKIISTMQHPMGSRNGVLADCELPGPIVQLMRLDASELWNQMISLFLTVLHELGHFWGLGHINTPNCVMNPYLNAHLTGLQPGDIAAMQQLYPGAPAKPTPAPTPTPDPTPTPGAPQYIQTVYDAVTKQPIRSYAMTALPNIVR